MIKNRNDLKDFLSYEKKLYNISFFDYITRNPKVYNWRYIKFLRKSEYYRNTGKWYHMPLFAIMRLKKNLLGKKINVEIGDNSCDKGLMIYHYGSIVISGYARCGKNLELHGCNCIGNNGLDLNCPVIGDNVKMGVGAIVIGNVKIADNVKIGANATCIKDCLEENVTLVGTPAKIKK